MPTYTLNRNIRTQRAEALTALTGSHGRAGERPEAGRQ
jgi:hypothetical protein